MLRPSNSADHRTPSLTAKAAQKADADKRRHLKPDWARTARRKEPKLRLPCSPSPLAIIVSIGRVKPSCNAGLR